MFCFFSHIYVVDFTADDQFLLSGSADETVMIWSLETLFEDLQGMSSQTVEINLALEEGRNSIFCF